MLDPELKEAPGFLPEDLETMNRESDIYSHTLRYIVARSKYM